jgi:RNA polymerase sigma-70 factor (ECF subfamily)
VDKLTDLEIIESILRGNQSDFNLIIDRYKNRAFSMLRRTLNNDLDAEEVLQDSFVKVYFGLKNFRKDSKFSTWLYRIVYNCAMTKLSSKTRKIEMSTISIDDGIHLEIASQNFDGDSGSFSEVLTLLVEKLPPKYSAVIDLFYKEELNCEEISNIMGESVSNVKVLLHRARNMLKELIEKNNLKKELL